MAPEHIGLIRMSGRLSLCTTFGGHRYDESISSLQKLIRRGHGDAARRTVVDLVTTATSGSTRVHKAMWTNVCNRLRVVSVEDVGIAAPHAVLYVDKGLEKAVLARQTGDNLRAAAVLGGVAEFLAVAPKLRMLSDLKSVYHLPPYYSHAVADLRPLTAQLRRLHGIPQPDASRINWTSARAFRASLTRHPHDAWHAVGDALHAVSAKLYTRSGGDNKFFSTAAGRDVLLAFFDVLHGMCTGLAEKVVGVLRRWCKTMTHRERPIYMYEAVLIVVVASTRKLGKLQVPQMTNQDVATMLRRAQQTITEGQQPVATFPAPLRDAVDVHTNRGRQRGASAADFAKFGAIVHNEVGRRVPMRRLYNQLKLLLVHNRSWSREELNAHARRVVHWDTGDFQSTNSGAGAGAGAGARTHASTHHKRCRDTVAAVEGKGRKKQRVACAACTMPKKMWRAMREHQFVVGQVVTGKHKPVVHLLTDTVVKGPYGVESKAPAMVCTRTSQFVRWAGSAEGACVVPSQRYVAADGSGRQFLVTKNVGRMPTATSTKLYHRWSGRVGVVADRLGNDVVTVSKLLADEHGVLTPQQWRSVFQHLLLRFVMQCGDTGLWNMLLVRSTGRVYGIDFEDCRVAVTRAKCSACTALSTGEMAPCLWHAMFFPKPAARASLRPMIRDALVAAKSELASWWSSRPATPADAVQRQRWMHVQTLLTRDATVACASAKV